MNLHEYQAKQLFADYGLPVPSGIPCVSADEAVAATKKLGGDKWVVKCQVHAGGRAGHAGGVGTRAFGSGPQAHAIDVGRRKLDLAVLCG